MSLLYTQILSRFPSQGAKLFYLSGLIHGQYPRAEISNLARFISVMKFHPLDWRSAHPYVVADRVEDLTNPEEVRREPKCDRTISLYGYVRGTNLLPGSSVHIPGTCEQGELWGGGGALGRGELWGGGGGALGRGRLWGGGSSGEGEALGRGGSGEGGALGRGELWGGGGGALGRGGSGEGGGELWGGGTLGRGGLWGGGALGRECYYLLCSLPLI